MSLLFNKLRHSPVPILVLAGIGLLLLVITLWLPFGLYSGDIQEHWHIRAFVDLGYNDYNVDLGELALTRPMARILFWLAYYISPDSFLGDNLLLISLLWLKGIGLMAVTLRLFPKRYLLAFLIAAVAILYPIDTGVVSLRVPHAHFGITAYFFALYCLLSYWHNHQARYLYISVVLLTLCCFGYEIFYPMIALSPAILFLYERRISIRLIKTSIAWYIPPAFTLLYSYVLIFGLGFGFQASAFQGDLTWEKLIDRGISPYINTLYSIWNPSALGLQAQWMPLVLVVSSFFFLIACLIFLMSAKNQRALSFKEASSFLIGSFFLIGLGFLILVPTNRAEYHENYRVFLTSSIGAAAFVVAIVWQLSLSRLPNYGFILVNLTVSIFVALSLNFHLIIHQNYSEILPRQGRFFEQILATLPESSEPLTIIVLPEGGSLSYNFGIALKPHIFTPALQYLYEGEDTIRFAYICNDDQTTCQFQNDQVIVRYRGRATYSSEEVILYALQGNGTLSLLTHYSELPGYQIEPSNQNLVPVPRRLETIFR